VSTRLASLPRERKIPRAQTDAIHAAILAGCDARLVIAVKCQDYFRAAEVDIHLVAKPIRP
jgi:hypothetical protein